MNKVCNDPIEQYKVGKFVRLECGEYEGFILDRETNARVTAIEEKRMILLLYPKRGVSVVISFNDLDRLKCINCLQPVECCVC